MCTYSIVLDHYKPQFDNWLEISTTTDYWGPNVSVPEIISPEEVAFLKELIKDFKEASEAAKVVDKATNQPDCEDPEKKQLEDRVTELEKRLDNLTQGIINQ